MRATLVVEYDVNPEHYGTADPIVMAQMDAESDDVIALMADAPNQVSFTVEPVNGEATDGEA
jgi:hypothetical protein